MHRLGSAKVGESEAALWRTKRLLKPLGLPAPSVRPNPF